MYKYVKRWLDIVISIVVLLLGAVPMVVIALLIKLDSSGPVLFKQQRYGKDKKIFKIYKFRTMSTSAPRNIATYNLANSEQYITNVGHLLRKFGIDELPQLFNILKGDMSFIGPRPVILAEDKLIAERDRYGANAVLPGISGWAQANGRDELHPIKKAQLDGYYVNHFSFKMDLKCVFKTLAIIFSSKGFCEGQADFGQRSLLGDVNENKTR